MKITWILAAAFLFSGCMKDACWTCETHHIYTYSNGRPSDTTTFTNSVCEYEASMDDYEDANSYTSTVTSGGSTTKVEIITRCND